MAQVKVIISGGFSSAYRPGPARVRKTTGISVTTGSGRVAREGAADDRGPARAWRAFDVVIMSREGLTELIAAGRASSPGSGRRPRHRRARRGGARRRAETGRHHGRRLQRALLLGARRSSAVPQSTSGIYLLEEVFPKLGIADRINVKVVRSAARNRRLMVASGEADIAVQPISELMQRAGDRLRRPAGGRAAAHPDVLRRDREGVEGGRCGEAVDPVPRLRRAARQRSKATGWSRPASEAASRSRPSPRASASSPSMRFAASRCSAC